MMLRRLAGGAGLFIALLAGCDSATPPTPTVLPTPSPVVPTASPVPPSPAPTAPIVIVAPPTATPAPLPATATPVALTFDVGLDTARLKALYAQAAQQMQALAPDAQLTHVRLELLAFAKPPLVQFDFYAPGASTLYSARAVDGSDIGKVEQAAAPTPLPVMFASPPWLQDADWPGRIAALVAQARVQPDSTHGRWRFTLDATGAAPAWQVGMEGTFLYTLADGQVMEQAALPGQAAGAPVPVPTGTALPFGFTLDNAAVDRYYRSAERLVTPKAGDAALRAVDIRLGDPADQGEDTVLYHFYSARQKQDYLATFDIGGRREVTPQPMASGVSKAAYRESTLPWKTAPSWPGLIALAAQSPAFTDQPPGHVRLLVSGAASSPATWTLAATLVYP